MAHRRANGEGCISKRKDGRWVATLSIGRDPVSGAYRRKTLYAKTKSEAKDLLTKARQEVLEGVLVVDASQPLEVFLKRWLVDAKSGNIKLSSLMTYEMMINTHIIPKLGKIPLNKLTPMVIQQLLNEKAKQNNRYNKRRLSPQTIQMIRAILNNALRCAVKWNFLSRNPVEATEGPRIPRSQATAFEEEETTRFLKAIQGHRLECLFLMAITTGMRQGEILGLKWSNVDIETGLIRVEASLKHLGKRSGETYTLSSTKTHETRSVAIPAFVLEKMKAHKLRQHEEKRILGLIGTTESFVFTTQNGTPFYDANVRRYYTNILKQAKLRQIRFHDLRHSCASILLQSGMPISEVSRLLGHAQVATTLNIYSHVAKDSILRIAERMESTLGNGNSRAEKTS